MRNHPGHAVEVDEIMAHEADHGLIRQATLSDIPAMLQLVNDYAANEVMLPRTEVELCERVRDFVVAVDKDGHLLGCGALQFYTPRMAELRSLAVAPSSTRSGLGLRICAELMQQAREVGVEVVFAFTYVPKFFEKAGFQLIDRAALPLKAWRDCLRCPKFHACDEIAMAAFLAPGAEAHLAAEPPSEPNVEGPLVMPTMGKPRVM
ncbi:MAG: N-acetyltransferase [Acidobacteria bacterium]|nr:N-acetyltransferase [Acidobacteriota bacterium]